MQIIISNNAKEPIYQQIYEQIKKQSLTNQLKPSEALPSMRTLAKHLNVSLITTKRAYEELEKDGFIYSVVGKGSFVSELNKEMILERKRQIIEEQLMAAMKNGKEIGLGLEEMLELVRWLYEEGNE